ncbi:sigma-70 family RNA polymerase sigma factor [Caldicellulosiruptoraceae bacterium PP1]
MNSLRSKNEFELIERAKRHDKEAMQEIIDMFQPVVKAVIRKYNKPSLYEDLLQEGNLAIIQAINNYDPSKNIKFITYAYYWIERNIQRCIIRDTNIRPSFRNCNVFSIPNTHSLEEVIADDENITLKDVISSNDDIQEQVEKRIMLNEILSTLTKEQKQILILKSKGYSNYEIAKEINIDESKIKFIIYKIRVQCKKLLNVA